MKIFRLIWLLIVFDCTIVNAQLPAVNSDGSITIKGKDAAFDLVPYANNVVKIVVRPNGYTTSEMISDAVIAKPLKIPVTVKPDSSADYIISCGAIQLTGINDTIYFGNKKNALLAQ